MKVIKKNGYYKVIDTVERDINKEHLMIQKKVLEKRLDVVKNAIAEIDNALKLIEEADSSKDGIAETTNEKE